MPENAKLIEIHQVSEITDELYLACQRLVTQLTNNNPPPTQAQLARMLSDEASVLFVARHKDFGTEITGMVTLVIYRVPTGVRGYIEDMVVDERARGKGIAEALTRACLDRAALAGASQVMLTSNPSRLAANKLFQRLGFMLRKTNCYKYDLKKG